MRETIKKIVNSNKLTKSAKDYIKSAPYYRADRKQYYRAKSEHASSDYTAIMVAHSLEKGMSFDKPRPFAKEKVKELIELYKDIKDDNASAKSIAINTLREYVAFYERHGWTNEKEYTTVKQFLDGKEDITFHEAGVKEISIKDIKKGGNMDYEKFLLSRHSIRNFDSKKLKKSDFEKAVSIAKLTPSACNRQMIKAILCASEEAKNAVVATIKKNLSGFNIESLTPIVITYDAAAFDGPLERNQGNLNAGLFTMNLVNAMHSLGIASCICEFRTTTKAEKALKKTLQIPKNERIAVTIMAGYYRDNNKIYVSQRISMDEIMRVK